MCDERHVWSIVQGRAPSSCLRGALNSFVHTEWPILIGYNQRDTPIRWDTPTL